MDEEEENIIPEENEGKQSEEQHFTIIKKTETILLPKYWNVQGLVS
jgi:hypothetical protein